MRITNNYLNNNLLLNLGVSQERMAKLQNQLSTGLKISRPSDDPTGIESALRLKNSIANVQQWKANASEGLSYMDSADSTLQDMGTILHRASELAVQGANGTMTTEDREKVALEIDQLKEHLVQLANTKVGDKYIFSGTANVEPFPQGEYKTGAEGAETWQWVGAGDEVEYPVGSNIRLAITVNGKDLFSVKEENGTMEIGLLKSFEKLSNALRTSNNEDLQASISELDAHSDNIVSSRALLGARTNRMESIENQLDATLFHLTKNYSDIMDADMASTMIEFKTVENAYTAALSVGSRIIQPSLVDFMK